MTADTKRLNAEAHRPCFEMPTWLLEHRKKSGKSALISGKEVNCGEYWRSEMRTSTSIPRIYADDRGLKHGELTEKLIGIFFNIYNELGHGFLESVYEQAFSIGLAENGIFFQRQIAVPVWFH
jgi:hypothetical protein